MRTFDVFKHPTQGVQAVKQGFGWPAFFFAGIWAFVKRMWGIGFAFFGILFALILIETAFEQEGSEGGVLIMLLVQVALFITVGVKGNDWRRGNIVKRGFKHISTVQAEAPDTAIGYVAEQLREEVDSTQ